MISPKKIATLQAKAALIKRMVNITAAPGDVMRVIVSMGHGPAVPYLIVDGDPPLRTDPQCPPDHDPGEWSLKCDRVVRLFEPLLADALGMPARGRMTQHLASLAWVHPGSVGEAHSLNC